MAWKNKEVDYTGASAHDYIDSYTNRPEDMGSLLSDLINKSTSAWGDVQESGLAFSYGWTRRNR